MIVVVDNGTGNVGSVANMVKRAGGTVCVSADEDVIERAEKLILPGVGSFDTCISRLKAASFFEALERKVLSDQVPFLGICVGMQMLFESSQEGNLPGLGWLKGEVKKFEPHAISGGKLKVPHMGWNVVRVSKSSPLFGYGEAENRFYFVHSYYAACQESADVIARAIYGQEFTCAVQKENIFGVQFHPEKSHRFGLALIKNFIGL